MSKSVIRQYGLPSNAKNIRITVIQKGKNKGKTMISYSYINTRVNAGVPQYRSIIVND